MGLFLFGGQFGPVGLFTSVSCLLPAISGNFVEERQGFSEGRVEGF